ncbi:MAG: DUF3047 domain-containing protein [Pseudomonadota bacterium]
MPAAAPALLRSFSNAAEGPPPAPWRVVGLPGGDKPVTQFDIVRFGSDKVLRVRSDRAYGNLTHTFKPPPGASMLRWRWRLDQPVAGADLRTKNGDDAPIKVCALFDLPLASISFVERNMLRWARRTSGEHLPGATLCYVWDQKLAVGTELPNAFTSRMRFLVLNSAGTPLQRWVSHTRDLHTDYLNSFGAEGRTVPPLLAIVVGADSDNTAQSSLAYVGDISLMEQ